MQDEVSDARTRSRGEFQQKQMGTWRRRGRLAFWWRTGAVGLGAALLALGTTVITPLSSASAQPTVQVWTTTTNSSDVLAMQLYQEPSITFGSTTSTTPEITVNPSTTYQTVQGFGGGLPDASAYDIYNSPEYSQIMNLLYSSSGAGFNFTRLPMGASDLSLTNYTYDDQPAGDTDPTLAHFSVAHDTAYIIPTLQEALKLDPTMEIDATPWSAPAWMKAGDTYVGDCTGTDQGPYSLPSNNYLLASDYSVYAQYFADFVKAYEGTYGIPIYMVSMQNEPEYCNSGYATMNFDPDNADGTPNEASFSSDLRSALNSAGYSSVQILGYDHNWYDQNGDLTVYPTDLLENAPSGDVNAIGFHCYNVPSGVSDPWDLVQNPLHSAYPNVNIYFTECTGGSWSTNQANNLSWEALNNVIGPMNAWSVASSYEDVALNQNAGPNVGTAAGGCETCRGMITVDSSNGTFTPNEDYYAWAQFSKFVQPGAKVIASTNEESNDLPNIAFQNPDGSIVEVVANYSSSASSTFQVAWNGEGFNYTLPANSIVTFKWSPSGTTSPATTIMAPLGSYCGAPVAGTALNMSTGTASSNTTQTSPPTDSPQNAINGVGAAGNGRFSSDANQTDGMYWEDNLGSQQTFDELQMQVPNSPSDYAVSYALETSNNGSSWTTVADCTGTSDDETVSFPTVTAQYIKVVDTFLDDGLAAAASNQWWSIDTLNLYTNGTTTTTTTTAPTTTTTSGTTTTTKATTTTTSGTTTTTKATTTTTSGTTTTTKATTTTTAATTTTTKATTTTTAPTTTTTAPTGINTSDWYEVVNENSGDCVDATNWGTSNGTAVQQWACASPAQADQEWGFIPVGSGDYEVLSLNGEAGGEAWNVSGGTGATSSGTDIQLWQYGGATNEQWEAVSLGGGHYEFEAVNSGLCLEVPGASTSNGVQLEQEPCNGSSDEVWSLVAEPDPDHVVNENSGSCVDATNSGTSNGTTVQQWSCNSPITPNQEWQLVSVGPGYYEVLNLNAEEEGEAWDVTGQSTSSGAGVQLWQYSGTTNEQWEEVSLGSGYYEFEARNSGLCLDVPSSSTSNGVQLQQYACSGSTGEAWKLTPEVP